MLGLDAAHARRRGTLGGQGADFDLLEAAFLGATDQAKLTDGSVPENKYRYIVIDWFHAGATLNAIKAEHPAAKILAYQNLAGMRVGPHSNSRPSSLVTYEDANGGGHEDWFLHKEAGGARIQFSDFTDLYAANVDDTGWRTAARQHLDDILTDGFHGIMLDDANTFPGHGFNEGDPNDSTEFASNNAYRDALAGAIVDLYSYASSISCLVSANVGADPWNGDHRAGFTAMLGGLDIWNRESYHSWSAPISATPFDGSAFADLQAMVAEAEAAGVASQLEANPLNPVDHTRMIRFGHAAFLLEWGGATASAYAYNNGEPIASYGQYRKNLGAPTEAKQLVSGTSTDGAWMRHWTGGVACVNAKTTSGLVTFTLGGTYLDPSNASVTSVQLDKGHGMVLLVP